MEEARHFLNPESVSVHLYCSVCQDVFREPFRAPCGHSFCKECINSWLSQSQTCPEDRKPINQKQLHYDFILANIIGDQMVACPFRSKGCEFVNKLETLSSHKKSCVFNPINLPSFMKESPFSINPNLGESHDEETLATPGKPSLKMRLFCDENKRNLLCSVFENKVEQTLGKKETSNKVWLNKENEIKKPKRRAIEIYSP
ncbi:E3 ubiquitin-protein ligase LNX isoform X1 [Hydra vulgaris]|uniref:E3 ubiquitin-protein ligase LNX isoform X1 n=1 Tax=Hydra vulgaris TaxID=6087 RepID=UPI001F5F75E5|nr:E3 ubiquitin-protein ligase LNX [Hydra vulgaris]